MQAASGVRPVSEIGEFGLISGITNILDSARVRSSGKILGAGDDAALWRPRPGRDVAITTDMLVEGMHFRHDWIDAESLGHRALAVNLSDLAAMGARPRVAVVSLGLRGTEPDRWVYDFYRGMVSLGQRWHTRIVGGDIVSSPTAATISITAHGEVRPDRAMLRDQVQPLDIVAVTGPLGLAAAGVRILGSGMTRIDGAPSMLRAHRTPQPRVLHGLLLSSAGVRAAMDISDGLLGDLPKMCAASNVSVQLEEDDLPIPRSVRWAFPDWQELALRGGEDFELLFSAAPDVFDRVQSLFQRFHLAPPIAIGKVTRPKDNAPAMTMRCTDQRRIELQPGAFDHFGSGTVSR
jgi:thiamine-monophosphate kinase